MNIPESYIGPERRIAPPISREEHDMICSASERKLNERFASIHDRFVDGTTRMNRIEASINEIKVANANQGRRIEDISKLQYELATHIEQIDKGIAGSADKMAHRFEKQDKLLEENTEITQSIKDVLNTAKGAFKFFGYLGAFLKWGLGIGAAVLAFWVALKDFRVH